MPAEVVKFYPKNAADKADNVLEQAVGCYQDVLILGYDHEGNADYRGTTYFSDGGNVLWLLEKFKHLLLNGDLGGE